MSLKVDAEPKKQKVEYEKRICNENWTEKYFFIEQNYIVLSIFL